MTPRQKQRGYYYSRKEINNKLNEQSWLDKKQNYVQVGEPQKQSKFVATCSFIDSSKPEQEVKNKKRIYRYSRKQIDKMYNLNGHGAWEKTLRKDLLAKSDKEQGECEHLKMEKLDIKTKRLTAYQADSEIEDKINEIISQMGARDLVVMGIVDRLNNLNYPTKPSTKKKIKSNNYAKEFENQLGNPIEQLDKLMNQAKKIINSIEV